MDDITFRAINVLKNSDLILCENTNNSKKLLNKYQISSKLTKYTDHDFEKKKESIKKLIKSKKIISLISDSGSPLISDPGNQLIKFMFDNCCRVLSIPGPSALISGIQLSGFLNNKNFVFIGFLPKKKDQKIKKIEDQLHNNLIIYTTKQQIMKDINVISEISSEYEIIVLKEITKIYEERIIVNKKNKDILTLDNLKGELILAVDANPLKSSNNTIDNNEIIKTVNILGIKKAYQVFKTKYKISRNEFYKMAMKLKND